MLITGYTYGERRLQYLKGLERKEQAEKKQKEEAEFEQRIREQITKEFEEKRIRGNGK